MFLNFCPPRYRCAFKDSDLYNSVCVFCSQVIELLLLRIEHLIVMTTDVATRTSLFQNPEFKDRVEGLIASLPWCEKTE